MGLRLRSNEASRPAPPQDHPRYLQNTLLALCQARIAGSAAKDVAGRAVIGGYSPVRAVHDKAPLEN